MNNRNAVFRTVCFSFVLSALIALVLQPLVAQNTTSAQRPTTLQVIHAAADPALSSVSLWGGFSSSFVPLVASGGLGAASFVQIGLGVAVPSLGSALSAPLQLSITAANSAAALPALASLPFSVGRGDNIIITAGVLRPRLFAQNPAQNYTDTRLIQIIDTVTTSTTDNVRLLFVHAASDAQRVEMVVRQTGAVLARLDYTQSSFATVPVGDYTIDVRFSTSQSIIASFAAPLQTLTFGGQRVTCVLTGFLNPKKNQDGQALGIVAVPSSPIVVDSVTSVTSAMLPVVDKPFVAPNPTTSLQIIDNAADAARAPLTTILLARTANSTTTTVAPIGQPLQFRRASLTLSTTAVTIGVNIVNMRPVPIQSVLTLDNVLGSQIVALAVRNLPRPGTPININPDVLPQTTLVRGANTVIATGGLDTTDYAKNPDGLSTRTRFTRFVDSFDSVATDSVRLLLFQGVTDAKQLDISIRGGDSIASLKYTEGRYLTLPAQQFTFDFTTYGTSDVIGSFILPLQDYAGRRISVMTSGFVNVSANSNGQPFALMLVPEQPSTTDRITLLQAAPAPAGVAETTLQMIQTSADMGLNPVGVAVRFPVTTNAGVFLPVTPSLKFRQADTAVTGLGTFAPFLKDIAGTNLIAYVTRANAQSAVSALYQQPNFNLIRGANIVLVSGMQRPSLFAPNPNNIATNIGLYQFVDRTRTIAADSVRLLVFHSVTDAPRVDILARGASSGQSATLATLSYGQGTWLTLPLADYTLDIAPTGTSSVLASYSAPLLSLGMGGRRLTISATGMLNPALNQSLAPLGLYAASNSSSIAIIGTTATTFTSTIPPLPNAAVVAVTGTTVSTTSYVISTSANGETTTSITTISSIFTPDPVSKGVKQVGPIFPTKPTVIATTTITVTSTLNSAIKMDVTTTTVSLLDGSGTITTSATTILYATTGSLSLSMMLPSAPLPATSSFSSKVGEAESITAAAYPNPAADRTTLSYTLKNDEAAVSISLFDAYGQFVSTLETGSTKAAGTYSLDVGTQTLLSGVYEARIVSQSGTRTVKVIVVR
jgi:hypothetical protein